jgi:methylated-DNA-[protein]-cysteine S-methyltransferase
MAYAILHRAAKLLAFLFLANSISFDINMSEFTSFLNTPLGIAEIKSSANGIRSVNIDPDIDSGSNSDENDWSKLGAKQLKEYFDGDRKEFDLAFDFSGYSSFFQDVWYYLLTIGFGETRSYLDVAKALGNPKAVRAVGMANGKNPVGIVVPCHRVIGSDGSLTGYAGGLEMKKWLLTFEGALKIDGQLSLF